MPLFDMSYNVSPNVPGATGYLTFVFPKFEKILHAVFSFDQSVNITGDTSGGLDISCNWGTDASQNNAVQLFIATRAQLDGHRRAVVTSDLTGKKFVVLAQGI